MTAWAKIRAFIGNLWGRTTTLVIAALGAAVPALQAIDPTLLPEWARLTIALLGVAVVVLRVIAPPPPAVTIQQDDAVDIDHASGTVTVTKAQPITADIQSKAAGEPVTAGEVRL